MDLPPSVIADRIREQEHAWSRGTYISSDLVQLGKQLGEATRLHIGNVYSTDLAGKRLQRHEISITRDLEYQRIHDTVSGRAIVSHPDAAPYFHMCTPHSLLIKQQDGRTRRLLWYATNDRSLYDPEPVSKALVAKPIERGRWLRCKIELCNKDGTYTEEQLQPRSVPTEGNVTCLESIVLDGKIFLLAAYDNGVLASYTEDLFTANSPSSNIMTGEKIISMTTINSRNAKEGILRTVSNLHATLDDSRLLVIISRTTHGEEGIRVRVFQMSVKAISPDKPIATLLLCQDVILDESMRTNINCSIHDSGQLHIWGDRLVRVFDLTTSASRPFRSFTFKDPVTSVLRLDKSSMAVCTTKTYQHINLEYSTTLNSLSWDDQLVPSIITGEYLSKIIMHDKRIGRILCLYGSKIVTISTTDKTTKTMADFLSRGLGQSELSLGYQETTYDKHFSKNPRGEVPWEDWSVHLKSMMKCAKTKDKKGFNDTLKTVLEFIALSPIQEFQEVVLTPIQRLQHAEKIGNVVSLVFEPVYDSRPEEFGLRIKFLPNKTLTWLIKNDLLRRAAIDTSFQQVGRIDGPMSVREIAVVDALAKFDETLSTLEYYILNASALTAAEVVYAITLALDAMKDQPKLLTNGAHDDMEVDQPAQTSLVHSTSHPENSLKYSTLIRSCVIRLLDYNHISITKSLRQHLDPTHLFSLIDFLRIELSQQGWFTDILHQPAYTSSTTTETHGITRLVKLLGHILDTLGMTPWLNAPNYSSSEAENLLTWMKLEISAALEAVEEATYISGVLHEVGLFTKLLNTPEQGNQRKRAGPITITVHDGVGGNALPAGLKPAGHIDLNVMQGGKVKKMSSRLKGHMKSKTVGRYTRERIDLNPYYRTPVEHAQLEEKIARE